MTQKMNEATYLEIIRTYFRKVDERYADLESLFSEEVDLFFPKFGTQKGKDKLNEFGRGMLNTLSRLTHDIEGFRYTVSGNRVVVEETESGRLSNGKSFTDNRFCSVFELDGNLITRIYIYTDPDFGGRMRRGSDGGIPRIDLPLLWCLLLSFLLRFYHFAQEY